MSNALAALEVLYTSVSMSFSSVSSSTSRENATQQSGADRKTGMHSGNGKGSGPPEQELALLAVGTLQQDILSYLRRYPKSTAMQWLEASGKHQQTTASVDESLLLKDSL